jgi:D-serine deaminase-like pyridoxal phosphate-dependent protein
MVDDVRHLHLVEEARASCAPVPVAVDVEPAREIGARRGSGWSGVMTREGQVAGVPDEEPGQRVRSAAVRRVESASLAPLEERRPAVASALREVADLEFWNAGGSGSPDTSAADPTVTEVTAWSGLLVSRLLDPCRSFHPVPAALFGLRVTRRPSSLAATVAGGGLVASGPTRADHPPMPWAPPGLRLTGPQAAGEVQTPLTGPAASALRIGDLVWFRHVKAGEVAEHVAVGHLLSRSELCDVVPTYRGPGNTW